MAEGESAACTNSFVAGTPVATPNGEQSIETLKVGDKVLAENPDTGEKGYYPITYTTHHLATDGLVLITIGSVSTNENKPAELFVASGIAGASTLGSASGSSSGSGPGSVTSSETIKATPQHPFWVPGRGWVNAGDLQPGDQLLSSDGRSLTVEATEVVSEQAQVYNFTVDQFHTYFVSQEQALVHNSPRQCFPDTTRYPIDSSLTPQIGARQTGIDRAWRQEKELVERTGKGSQEWSATELAELISTGEVRGYTGHHINNFHRYPQWAGDPRNIIFLGNGTVPGIPNDHVLSILGHFGHFRNQTSGDLIDRVATLQNRLFLPNNPIVP